MTTNDLNQIRGVIKEEVGIVEERLDGKINQLSVDLGMVLEKNILPMIAEKADKSDIDRLESKLDKALDKNIDLEKRVRDIEQVSVVAHELKSKNGN